MQRSSKNQGIRHSTTTLRRGERTAKVKMAELPGTPATLKVSLAYTEDSKWRNRDEFFRGREVIRDFLKRKWARELDYRLEEPLVQEHHGARHRDVDERFSSGAQPSLSLLIRWL